jgi:peptidyl-prolyl cis-trans isomerase SurA
MIQKSIFPADEGRGRKAAMLGCIISKRSMQNLRLICAAVLATAAGLFSAPGARAQEIIATVNGAPITNWDVSEREKLLRVEHKPSTYDDAFNSMVDDQLKLGETNKFKITASDGEIGQQIALEANQMNMAPAAFMGAMQQAGISTQHIKDHFSADFEFGLLVQAYNKGIDASEGAVRAELAKDGGKSAAGVDYRLHQVIFTLHGTNVFAETQERIKAAEQLRLRFTSCADGLPLARDMDNVAVKDEIIRNSLQISDQFKDLLEKTPIGHLTPPERTSDGIEMIAVCGKGVSSDDSAVRKAISDRLLSAEMRADAERRLAELRSYAVIVKR